METDVIIAGKQAAGKTTFALTIANNYAKDDVVFVNRERLSKPVHEWYKENIKLIIIDDLIKDVDFVDAWFKVRSSRCTDKPAPRAVFVLPSNVNYSIVLVSIFMYDNFEFVACKREGNAYSHTKFVKKEFTT